MTVTPKCDAECAFDVRSAAFDVQYKAIRMFFNHSETVPFGKPDDGLIVLFGWPETRRKFSRGKKSMKVRAVGIIKLLKELRETVLVSQWQAEGQTKPFVCWHALLGYQPHHDLRYVSLQGLHALAEKRGNARYPDQDNCSRSNL